MDFGYDFWDSYGRACDEGPDPCGCEWALGDRVRLHGDFYRVRWIGEGRHGGRLGLSNEAHGGPLTFCSCCEASRPTTKTPREDELLGLVEEQSERLKAARVLEELCHELLRAHGKKDRRFRRKQIREFLEENTVW